MGEAMAAKTGDAGSSLAGGCPVPHDERKVPRAAPSPQASAGGLAGAGGCTAGLETATASLSAPPDAINPLNNMPPPNQRPAPGQKYSLPTDRVVSSIPKGGSESEEKWVFPSEQMFYNAMRRKAWNPNEDDMSTVVSIHNAVNERAWGEVLKWEKMHEGSCPAPKLLRFRGRPQDFSPKARLRSWFGYTLPFDRHDWVVDRCGTEVTYVIDFYQARGTPDKPLGFYLDCRPAVSVYGVIDRFRMAVRNVLHTDAKTTPPSP